MRPDIRELWNAKAGAWNMHVGADGDANRRYQSDPVLHRLLGPVDGLRVLDHGCGTGYLSAKLARAGASVIGVDISPAMIAIANKNLEQAGVLADLRVDDGQELSTVDDASVDAVVSNYVLMDLPDHEAALHAISRVLMPGGVAVLVFLHPCFDTPEGPTRGDDGVSYHWPRPYVERWSFDCRWGSFDTAFHTFHRSLSDYWRAFSDANLNVTAFEEPVVPSDHPELTADVTARARWTPFSVAFKLSKPAAR